MKILIIHATAGAGHKKAAEAIFNSLSQTPHSVRLEDALDFTNPFFKKSYPASYSFLVTKLPLLWRLFFALLNLPLLQPAVRVVRRTYNGLNAGKLQDFLIKEQFDCIVTTQFLSAEVCAYLKRTGQIKSRVICVVTDFDVHRIWVNEGIDAYAVASPYTKKKVESLGVAAEQVFVTGIPTDQKFARQYNRAQLKDQLGMEPGFTVLIATGSFGMGPIEALIQGLGGYQLIVICGHNKHLFERLKPLAGRKTHIYGLIANMDELMAASDVMVTKPGGLSIAEALVKQLPMVFFSAIPGQETNNIRVLKQHGVAQDQMPVAQIIARIDDLYVRPEELARLRQGLAVLSKPDAVSDIIKIITAEAI